MALQSFDEALATDNQLFMVTINGEDHEGFFANIRVDRENLPQDWYAYDLRHSDDGMEICEIKNGYVFVNHAGTFCTQDDLNIPAAQSLYADDEFDYSFE